MRKAVISIVMGSSSDSETMNEAVNLLKEFSIAYEVKILSAHRMPDEVRKFAVGARKEGIRVIIAAAGGAAALAGVIASHTTLPVIGVPVETKSLKGLDSLLSTVQMPSGVPVGCMCIGQSGAKNAVIFALEILSLNDKSVERKLALHKKNLSTAIKLIPNIVSNDDRSNKTKSRRS